MQTQSHYAPTNVKKLVVKLGTGILTSGIGQLDLDVIRNICAQIAELRKNGITVIIVSSGAVGLGMGRLGINKRPSDLPTLQACASVGQSILIETWQKAFDPWGLHVGQMLLTRDDLSVKKRHVAVRDTLERLLKSDIIPIVNENDCISVDELKFGDNDLLSALLSSLLKADLLAILSTIPGLMNLKTGEVIPVVKELSEDILGLAEGTNSPTAVGGMVSKLNAVSVATNSDCGVYIAAGKEENILLKLLSPETKGTYFVPSNNDMPAHKRWLAFFNQCAGKIRVDEGAANALSKKGKSLLAKGITHVNGVFPAGSVLEILDEKNTPLARGISQFSSEELEVLTGKSSSEIRKLFPDRKHTEVVHRDSMALIEPR